MVHALSCFGVADLGSAWQYLAHMRKGLKGLALRGGRARGYVVGGTPLSLDCLAYRLGEVFGPPEQIPVRSVSVYVAVHFLLSVVTTMYH